ncbi:MAG: tRNA (N(6)-L-threonylcarbamoyladenosine(37)-C(2))-methylthiotransferase MtaB [Rickettsiales bacterium]|nr:tRNA (N(6)-L-threonylcarbamoyladenosine(37)-C(2))-methylthiotransferase MtaB [Rickettsiales bacterium]
MNPRSASSLGAEQNEQGQSVQVLNFGCRLNAYEAQVMKNHATDAGMSNTILVNSCAVTKEAERQVRQSIRKARKANPDAEIIVSGCAAQIHPEEFAAMPEVSRVIGNEEKLKAETYGAPSDARISVNNIMEVTDIAAHLVSGFDDHVRGFIQVQNGCNHRCTFCIIPFGRGNSRSVPLGEIVAQVRSLVDSGYKEVVLTGVDISDYGKDLPGEPTFSNMLRRILNQVPELPRLRISSIDAVEMDDGLFQLLAEEPRLMPHLHLSLQAGDNMILKRMKRRHSREDAIEFAKRVRAVRPDAVFGADIITGFPTETEEMFQNSIKLVEEMDLAYVHVFPYSERDGTPAARMPQVEKSIRKERGKRLRAAGKVQLAEFLQNRIGKKAKVLVEKPGRGRCEHYTMVHISDKIPVGSIVEVEISATQNEELIAA